MTLDITKAPIHLGRRGAASPVEDFDWSESRLAAYDRATRADGAGTCPAVISTTYSLINPPGVWHTADSGAGGWIVTITPGLDTEHRPR